MQHKWEGHHLSPDYIEHLEQETIARHFDKFAMDCTIGVEICLGIRTFDVFFKLDRFTNLCDRFGARVYLLECERTAPQLQRGPDRGREILCR